MLNIIAMGAPSRLGESYPTKGNAQKNTRGRDLYAGRTYYYGGPNMTGQIFPVVTPCTMNIEQQNAS